MLLQKLKFLSPTLKLFIWPLWANLEENILCKHLFMDEINLDLSLSMKWPKYTLFYLTPTFKWHKKYLMANSKFHDDKFGLVVLARRRG